MKKPNMTKIEQIEHFQTRIHRFSLLMPIGDFHHHTLYIMYCTRFKSPKNCIPNASEQVRWTGWFRRVETWSETDRGVEFANFLMRQMQLSQLLMFANFISLAWRSQSNVDKNIPLLPGTWRPHGFGFSSYRTPKPNFHFTFNTLRVKRTSSHFLNSKALVTIFSKCLWNFVVSTSGKHLLRPPDRPIQTSQPQDLGKTNTRRSCL